MSNDAHMQIAEAVDRGLQGAPKVDGQISASFIEFIKLIYTPEEAEIVQHLEIFPHVKTTAEVAGASGRDIEEVTEILDGVHAKYGLMGSGDTHCLPTVFYILNFHHRYAEVKPGDLEAAEHYQQFFVREKFYQDFETSRKGTPLFRTIPVGRTIAPDQQVLGSEEALSRIEGLGTDFIALVPCPCRTRTEKLGVRECKDKFPIGCCIIPGVNGEKFVALCMGKQVSKVQAKDYLEEMLDLGLVPNTDNYTSPDPFVICLCCGCCCSMTRGRTRWDNPESILPSNFIPVADDDCAMCGTCVDRCFFSALSLDHEADRAVVDPNACIGCGVCAAGCPTGALKLQRYERSQSFETVFDFAMQIRADNAS
ncbi:MAG: 4Fe-4S binding protein [Deltaproteobacteria bacterium]|nr:4Fe-4S binding protein [Deltaproteobacteria bacterium]